jgi:mono/diheme cytochrome c family protein
MLWNSHLGRWLAGLFLVGGGLWPTPARAADYERDIWPILQQYCVSCHGDQAKPKGELRLTQYARPAAARAAKPVFKTVAETLTNREMPPAGKPQPSDAERQRVADWVAALLAEADLGGQADPGRPVLRRLTRLEYNNTLRDLLGLRTDLLMFPERLPFKPAYFTPHLTQLPASVRVEAYEYGAKLPALLPRAGIPGDNRAEHGFTNRGDALNLTPLLFEKYLATADELLQHPQLAQVAPRLVPVLTAPDRATLAVRLRDFMSRAFRRPVRVEQVEVYLRPFDAARAQAVDLPAAIRTSLAAVLASPDFLFRVEGHVPTAGVVRPVDGYERASRLAYFLWASLPDEELFAAAAANQLQTPAELERQARRMLRHPHVRELAETFAVQWLRLNELWAAQPDRRFKSFYSGPQGKGTLHADLMAEALLFFQTVLVEDRSILEFIDADWGYANQRLLAHYGLTNQYRAQFQEAGLLVERNPTTPAGKKQLAAAEQTWLRIRWPNRERGGLLTCGAVLTLTSLPTRTSPVKRGAWVLESVYNRPPPPPNVAVEPLDDAKDTATTTVRAKLEAHRANASCAGCHAKIDPLGFALENFDPTGAWRTQEAHQPVDSTGTLPDGRSFNGPAAFKTAVLNKRHEFVRGFIEHLLGYALGRKLEYYDTPEIDRIVTAVANDGYRFSRAVVEVVKSYPFTMVRNLPDN